MVRKRIADAHNDYLMHLRSGQRTLDDDMQHQMHTSLESLQKGEVALQVFAAFAEDAEGGAPLLQALEMIHWYGEMLRRWAGAAMPVYDAVSLKNAENAGSIGALLSIEGGEACAGSVLALDTFRRLGVRMMTLLWNRENALGHPACMAAFSGEGLKPFGRACVRFINRNRMAVDVSHLNAGGFRDVCTLSQRPFLASHSNAYAVCPHPRNLTDYQIRAIADAGGFIGLNFFPDFLSNRSESTLEDVLQHARHILHH